MSSRFSSSEFLRANRLFSFVQPLILPNGCSYIAQLFTTSITANITLLPQISSYYLKHHLITKNIPSLPQTSPYYHKHASPYYYKHPLITTNITVNIILLPQKSPYYHQYLFISNYISSFFLNFSLLLSLLTSPSPIRHVIAASKLSM